MTRRFYVPAALVAWLGLVVGCGGEAPGGSHSFSDSARGLLAKVPGEAFGVIVIDSSRPVWSYLTRGVLLPNKPEIKDALEKELKAFVEWRFGVDVSRAQAGVLFAMPRRGSEPVVGVMVQGIKGTLKGSETDKHQGIALRRLDDKLVYAQEGDTLILGDAEAVRAVLDVSAGKGEPLAKKNPALARLIERHNAGAFLSMAAELARADDPQVHAIRARLGIDSAAIRISGKGVHAVASGDADKLDATAKLLRGQLERELRKIAELKEHSTKEGVPAAAGLATIVQYHFMKNAIAHLNPRVSGKELVISMPMELGEQSSALIAFVGVASATAIPAFLKYTKKAKSSEPRENLNKLYRAARSYYLMHHTLPPSAGPTPSLGSCCRAGGKCQPSLFAWRDDTWRKLGFSVDQPHRYSYSFINAGGRFTVRANGDLDCDGEYSTFEMSATTYGGTIPPTATLLREKELE